MVTAHSRTHLITPDWFDPTYWGNAASRVQTGGRGGAYVVNTPIGPLLLRRYLRGGMVAPLLKDKYFWHGGTKTRSFAEFFLTAEMFAEGAPVPEPIAAYYWRTGKFYRAAILVQFLHGIDTFGSLIESQGANAPWAQCGQLISRAHRKGLNHADLNAHNIVFNQRGEGWLIDFDRSKQQIPETEWRQSNLDRLARSIRKIQTAGKIGAADAEQGIETLRQAYETAWARGI